MAAKRTTPLEQARAEAELWRARANGIRAEYDVLRSNRLRRTPRRETKPEGGIIDAPRRALASNIGRDLERNYSPARGIVHQYRSNVVGSKGTLQILLPGADDAVNWFNEVWAKDCDYRDDMHWSDYLQNVVAASLCREGDVLTVFDDDLIEDSGKLISWESDQIVPVSDDVLRAKGMDPAAVVQDTGILRNRWGRVIGYCVTGKRGVSLLSDPADVTIWQRDDAILPRSPWRFNQGRGVGAMLTAAASLLDIYEMLARELATAKRAAAQYAWIGRPDGVTDWDDPAAHSEYLPENDGKTAADVSTDGAVSTATPNARNYESLEAFTGGFTDYMDSRDKPNFAPTDRPNVHMPEFIEAVQCQAGFAFGLARAYSMLRADSSYTAFRGDMILSWHGAFYPAQKWLERQVCDRIGRRAINWGLRTGAIRTAPPAGWERAMAWDWPTMPEVDQLDYENSIAQALKNGTTDYARELGPRWRQKLESLAEQIELIRKLGLPLSILEMKSGGTADNQKKESANGKA